MVGIDDAITAVSTMVDSAIKRIWPDATEIEKAKLEQLAAQLQAETNLVLGQLKINEIEAASPHWFVAAGRPAMIWVGVLTLFYAGIGISLLSWIANIAGYPPPPIIDSSVASDILMGLLGISGMRSFDKVKGTDTKQMRGK